MLSLHQSHNILVLEHHSLPLLTLYSHDEIADKCERFESERKGVAMKHRDSPNLISRLSLISVHQQHDAGGYPGRIVQRSYITHQSREAKHPDYLQSGAKTINKKIV